ncbi:MULTISPECIES: histidinol-phosphate transaminase [Brevibacterium]|uniref:Histidinol-phosphate aminotransferase n=2 Tax=Brevibacterium casei TaxID=33889 RepID=A0A2H1K951_9MICO|nr:histidinol-phosphate transaminase [Brevibacterium casei]NJE65460.1 histidinol-phosphate transaminase [Brevibacterium sp. LS14]SIG95774.1 histidinol-phosphate aminotransferase HisC1 [Mycobacteroides abscessus subsp. abscessus]KZE15965.1 aspartate aminotransferase [Brevibacterium casei]MCT1447658.1 histidinol-phosphate transaminase [Brevibacterium casei]MCT2183388.1 histidinol-phosphate transaminase [Brevibacterium casei]
MGNIESLPVRSDLVGREPYGAPHLDVPVQLNVNENAYPIPDVVVEAMRTAVDTHLAGLNRYPDREFTALREHLVDYLTGVNERAGTAVELHPEMIWAANGSNEVLSHIVQAFGGPGRTALGFTPSYSMHPLITTGTGAEWIHAERDDDYGLTAEAVAAEVSRVDPDIVFLCTPNNPTGTSLGLDVIEAAYENCSGIVIVDEAYAEFSRPALPSAMTLLAGRPRLVVSRTMSKAFACAGLRLGYAIAAPELIDTLRLVRLPYHLSDVTQVLACTALEHADLLLGNVDRLIDSRNAISARLAELGFTVHPSDSNFVLFGGIAKPAELWQKLLDRGILIRDIGIPHHARVNAGTEAETTAFLAAMNDIVADDPSTLLSAH